MELVDFLLARIGEDAAEARAAFSGQADPENGWGNEPSMSRGRTITPHVGVIHEEVQAAHVAKWNPARTLAECEAKRRIVEDARHTLFPDPFRQGDYWRGGRDAAEGTLRLLALPYADHPDYRQEWKP